MITRLLHRHFALVLLLLLVVSTTADAQQNPHELFQQARMLDESNQNLTEAIALYRQVATLSTDQRKLAAEAQLSVGLLYERLGQTAQAQRAYEAVLDEYADQTEVARQAQVRLLVTREQAEEESGNVVRQVWAGPGVDTYGGLSPDGRFLSFVDWDTGALALRDLVSGTNRYLTATDYPNVTYMEYALNSVISQDGKQVVYTWQSNGRLELRIIGLDESESRVLYANEEAGYIIPAAWSPDGKYILVTFSRPDKTNQIAMVSVMDGSVRVLKTLEDWRYVQGLNFSPDGRYIVFDFPQQRGHPARDVSMLAVDGSFERPLVEHQADDYLLGWIPESTTILIASDRTGQRSIWRVEVEDGKHVGTPQMVKKDVGRIGAMGFARNGSFYYSVNASAVDVYLAELDPQTGKIMVPPARVTRRFEGTNFAPDWSPDGKYLLYASRRDRQAFGERVTNKVLVIHSLETGEVREFPLTVNISTQHSGPRWSPDGRSILLFGADEKGQGLFRLDVETGVVSVIVHQRAGARREPVWSADGKAILFQGRDQDTSFFGNVGTLVMRDLETGQEKTLYSGHHLHGWVLSPDGRRLAVGTEDPDTVEANLEDDVLRVIPVTAEGAGEVLIRVPGPEDMEVISWTSDGQGLLFRMAGELWRVSAAGGEPRKLELAIEDMHDIRFHPDGRRIAYTIGSTYMNEIWVMENYLPADDEGTK